MLMKKLVQILLLHQKIKDKEIEEIQQIQSLSLIASDAFLCQKRSN